MLPLAAVVRSRRNRNRNRNNNNKEDLYSVLTTVSTMPFTNYMHVQKQARKQQQQMSINC